jgi:hypothetical protein
MEEYMSAWIGAGAYNIHRRTIIPKLLEILISWEGSSITPSGYRVRIGTRKLAKLFGDLDCAKKASLNFAKMVCRELQTSIVNMEIESKENLP